MAEKVELTGKQKQSVRKLLESANLLHQKISDKYDNVLIIMKEAGVPWGAVTEYLQDSFTDWPVDEASGKYRGVKALLREKDETTGEVEYEPAVWVNRFNVYRNKFEDYDKPKIVEARKPLSEMTPEERGEYRLNLMKQETERRLTKAHAVTPELLIHNLQELLTYAEVVKDTKVEKAVVSLFKLLKAEEKDIRPLTEIVVLPAEDDEPEKVLSVTPADLKVKYGELVEDEEGESAEQ